MNRKVINRIGEERVNNFGSKIVIKEYRKWNDIDVYFPKYDWTFEHGTYSNFKYGKIKCPYEPRVFGHGCIGEGKYEVSKNNIWYKIWTRMLRRCYDPKYHEKEPTYKDCTVENNWLNFQNMCEWLDKNYYEIPGEKMCLDKDILCKGNKVYSRETCIFVPERINLLFVKSDNARGNNPIGMYEIPSGNYQTYCNDGYGKRIHLGTYTNKEEGFRVYKNYKEKVIKEVIDSYEEKIPEPYYLKLKTAMYNYKVEIDD